MVVLLRKEETLTLILFARESRSRILLLPSQYLDHEMSLSLEKKAHLVPIRVRDSGHTTWRLASHFTVQYLY